MLVAGLRCSNSLDRPTMKHTNSTSKGAAAPYLGLVMQMVELADAASMALLRLKSAGRG